MTKNEIDFLEKVFLVNPITKERMSITKVEGAEEGLDHLRITTNGVNGGFVHKIYSEEI